MQSGPVPARLIRVWLGLVLFLSALAGLGTWEHFVVEPTLPPEVGFARFYYTFGFAAGLGAALLALVMVGYMWLVGAGVLPLVWVRRSEGGVRLASPLGRSGLRSGTLVLGPTLEARLFNDGRTPEIRVMDLKSHGRFLRVRCFGPIGDEPIADFVAVLQELGVKVTLTNELFDP